MGLTRSLGPPLLPMIPDITPLLDRALKSPNGIAINTDDIEHLRRTIYHKRLELRKLGVTIYDCLSFYTMPGNHKELYIVRSPSKPKASADASPE